MTTAQAADVIAIPPTALSGSAGSYTVQVVDSAGRTTATPVQVGLVTTSLAEIKSGLAAGDTVVTGTSAAKSSTSSAASSTSNSLNTLTGGAAGGPPAGGPPAGSQP